jgi:hypothetical protein
MLPDLESNRQQKNEQKRQDLEERKKRPGMGLKQKPAEAARERTTTISQNAGCLCKLNPRKRNPYRITNEDKTRK